MGEDGEGYVAAVVVMYYPRLNISSRAVRAGVVVRDEADDWHRGLDVRLQRGINIAFVVQLDVVQPLTLQFLLQVFSEDKLLAGAGYGLAVLCGLCIELGVVQESFNDSHV